jgi:hypothetical protein
MEAGQGRFSICFFLRTEVNRLTHFSDAVRSSDRVFEIVLNRMFCVVLK